MYLWIGLVLNKELEKQIRETCCELNKKYLLSESVFTLPQHISLKSSFPADNYLEIIKYIKSLFQGTKSIDVKITNITKINNSLIWLDIFENAILRQMHNMLNSSLNEKYNVSLNGFDGDAFRFHTTLFQDEKISNEHDKLLISIKEKLNLPIDAKIYKMAFGISDGGKPGTYKIIDYMDFQ